MMAIRQPSAARFLSATVLLLRVCMCFMFHFMKKTATNHQATQTKTSISTVINKATATKTTSSVFLTIAKCGHLT